LIADRRSSIVDWIVDCRLSIGLPTVDCRALKKPGAQIGNESTGQDRQFLNRQSAIGN
jgi:hypothetical protein